MSQGGKGTPRFKGKQGPTKWTEEARCKGADTNIFFPAIEVVTKETRDYCDKCPVSVECLNWATFLKPGTQGILANTTTVERRRIRKASSNGVIFEIDETAP